MANASLPELPDVCLVGHPFAPIGRGEDVRCTARALRSAAMPASILDLYAHDRPDPAAAQEFGPSLCDRLAAINVFHLNGDEVEPALQHLRGGLPKSSYNIIYPAWELPRYPREWAAQLDRFDEIWAPSRFIQSALETAVARSVHLLPLACEVGIHTFRSRRYFGIPEAAYAFLFYFDFRSFAARKNPAAVIDAFARACERAPECNATLVIKVHGSAAAPEALAALESQLARLSMPHVLIDQQMDDNDTKCLARCCDCFVSLHRAEGFGRGLAEAMYLGKPVIATRHSGNLDFMDDDSALLVDCELIPVRTGEYPHWQSQVWADADVEQAANHMVRLLRDPTLGYTLGARASRLVRMRIGWRSCGMRYRQRFESIASEWTPNLVQLAGSGT